MNISSNERLLGLLLKELTATLAPELQSSNTQAIAGIMQAVLAELIKRESRTPQLVSRYIDDGLQLITRIRELLRRVGVEPDAGLAIRATEAATLAAGLEQHADISRSLAALAETLTRSRGLPGLVQDQALVSDLLLRCGQWELGYYQEENRPLEPISPATPTVAGGPLTAQTLLAFVQNRHADGAAVSIHEFSAIPGGFGKQTSRFVLRDASGRERRLIVRKSDPHPMLSIGGFIIENEFHLLKAVSAAGYRAPTPLWLGSGVDGVDASFYVMECLPGTIPGSFLGGLAAGDTEGMLLDVATQLGRLHAYPREAFADYLNEQGPASVLTETVEACYRREIAQWRHYAAEVEQLSSPFLHYLIDWLERHVPQDSRPPVLLHGDFNIHNLLVENHRVSGVLDWECAMFGAPEQDLAYIQPHISQQIDWSAFTQQYLAAGGRELDTSSMPFYMAFSSLRLHIAMLRATRNLQSGINDDIRYAMVELAFGARFMELAMSAIAAHGG